MAGLDPATQGRSRRTSMGLLAQSNDRATPLGGRVKPGHDGYYLRVVVNQTPVLGYHRQTYPGVAGISLADGSTAFGLKLLAAPTAAAMSAGGIVFFKASSRSTAP